MLNRALENWPYKLFALFLAIALHVWVVSHNNESKASVKTVLLIPVKVVRIPPGLEETTGTENVSITVTGTVSADVLRTADFVATVDASNAHIGLNSGLPIIVAIPSGLQSAAQIESKSPSSAKISLEQLVEIVHPLRVNISKTPPLGYAFGNPVIAPTTVHLSGPASAVQRVKDVCVDFTGADNLAGGSVIEMLDVVARDAQGVPISGVRLTPRQARVTIPVTKVSATNLLAVSPVHLGQPAPGYEVLGISSEPAVATVTGPVRMLYRAKTVLTAPVDVAGATGDVKKIVDLQPPAGVTILTPHSVTVTVKIGARAGNTAPTAPGQTPAKP